MTYAIMTHCIVSNSTAATQAVCVLVMQHVRAAGGVCIADEVQTGFGRTGTKFWGFENQGVIPDIVTMAKGIGNGLPLAAVVTTEEVAQTMSRRLHFNTFGGNPVCSAGGRAVLKAIEEDGLQANSLKVGLSSEFKVLNTCSWLPVRKCSLLMHLLTGLLLIAGCSSSIAHCWFKTTSMLLLLTFWSGCAKTLLFDLLMPPYLVP